MRSILLKGGLALAMLALLHLNATGDPPVKPPNASFQKAVPRVDASFEPATARRGQTVIWKFSADLAPDQYTYAATQVDPNAQKQSTKFDLPAPGSVIFVGGWKEPPFKAKAELAANINEVRYLDEPKLVWERHAVISPEAKPGKINVKSLVTMMVCDSKSGKCLLPVKLAFETPLTISEEPPVEVDPQYKEAVQKALGTPDKPKDLGKPDGPPPPEGSVSGGSANQQGLFAFILSGIFWGAISLLTPCVFPMIPITVSFFLKQSEKEHHRPLVMAGVYSGTIVTVLTLGGLLLIPILQPFSQHWITNLVLGALFLFFALSLFGMYEIQLPTGLANFTSSQQGRGGLVGTMFMALTFTIISFTCVAPFYGSFIAFTASESSAGGWVKLFLGALAFSATFASPFFLLALFPSLLRTLPKSGSWMNTVKVVMGFLEVAAAVKFLRASELFLFGQAQFLTYDLALGMYVALSILCGLYLLGLFRLPHDDPPEHLSVPRFMISVLFLSLGVYLIPGLFKVDASHRQRPNGTVFAWLESFLLPDLSEQHIGSLAEGLKEARDKRKLVFIDFTGIT